MHSCCGRYHKDANRLVILWNGSPDRILPRIRFALAQYLDIKNGHQGFEQVAIAIGGNDNLTGEGEPERAGVTRVSSNLLPMLGVSAEQGTVVRAR